MSSTDSMWTEASRDVGAERSNVERAKAMVALAEHRSFLIQASSDAEFEDRLALVRDEVDRVVTSTVLLPADQEAVYASLREEALGKTAASGEIDVGSEVIWTEFGVPDFHDEVFRTDRAQNGRPWRVTKIETLEDYIGTKYPTYYQQTQADHLVGLAEEWVRKHPGLSEDPEDLEVARLERDGNQAVLPLGALVNSSVEVGAGQGEFSFASQKTAAAPGTAGKEAATKTASGEWGESEWSDEGASRVETVPGREGYLVADVYPSEFETGVWVWSIKPAYPLSEYPEVYDLGHAANMDEAKAAADTSMGRAVQSYREASVRTASASWLSAAREVVKSHQHTEVDGVILDATTASVLVQIYDGLSPENKAKFEAMSLGQAASIAWKIAG